MSDATMRRWPDRDYYCRTNAKVYEKNNYGSEKVKRDFYLCHIVVLTLSPNFINVRQDVTTTFSLLLKTIELLFKTIDMCLHNIIIYNILYLYMI